MAAAAVLALGVLGGLGALFDSTVMSRPLRAFPAASLGGSIGSLGLGFALLGWSTARRWLLRGGSALAVFVGGLPLLVRALTPEGSPPAGTFIPSLLRDVPATTGLFLLLGGLGLLALSARRRRRLAHVLAGVCGSTALLLAITVSIGRLTGFLEGTDGSLLNGASVYTLLVGAINGAMLMSLAAGYQESTWPVATWLPNTIGISVAVTVIFIWLALVDREDEQMQRQIDLASVLAAGNVRAELLRAMNGVDRLAIRVAVRSPAIDAALIEQTALLLKDDAQPLVAAAWPSSDQIGDTSHVIVVPSENPYKEVLTSAVQRQMRNPFGRDSANARPLDFFNVPNQHEVFAIGVRDCLGTPCRAPSAYVFDARRAFRGLLADSLTGFYLAVRLDTQRVVRSGLTSKTKAKWLRSTNIDLPAEGARWQITVWPTPATIARARTDLPAGVLVLGLALAMLLPVTLRLADTAWSAAARAERARVNTALESATDSLWVWDIANDTIERGSALWSRLGYPTPSGPVALSAWIALVHPKDQDAVRQAMSRHLAGSTESMELEYRVRDADDKWHWLVERGRLVERTEKGTPLRALGVTADITERKNADDALAASERKYRATFDSASQMKALLDDAGRIVEMNPAGRALCGASEGAIGRPIWEFPAFHGSQAMRTALTEACESGYAGKGTAFVVQLELEEVDSHSWDMSVTPIANSDGTVTQLLVNARDITDRKRAEQALRELGNLATMGRLTALVAHEINNPLAGIHSAFSLIKSAVPDTHPHFKYVGAIEREIARIAQVTQQLYETYRHEPEASRGASVDTVVSDAVAFIEQVNRRSSVRVIVDLTTAPQVVPFPDALIRRVVYNLVQNAVDASPENGKVYLTGSNTDNVFSLTVRDEGTGIPAEVRGRIFDPFISTKGPGMRTGGMGLGLALVHGSVTAFGGTVSVQDAPGGGSVFVVRLPLTHTFDGVPRYGSRAHTAR